MSPTALCINPWIYDFAAYDLWIRPLGLLTIAGTLRLAGVDVQFLDCLDRSLDQTEDLPRRHRPSHDDFGCGHYRNEPVATPSTFRDVTRLFKRYGVSTGTFETGLQSLNRPDIVLVTSGMTYWYPGVFDVIWRVKCRWPGVPVVLGGVYAALCRDHAARHSGADCICGTASLWDVLHAVSEVLDRDVTPESGWERRPPCPAYDLINHFGAAAVLTGKGCPYDCSYCASGRLEPEFTRFEPHHVVHTIEKLVRDEAVQDIAFYDDALLVHWKDHLGPILEEVMERDLTVRFHTPNGLHARFVTPGLAGTLKKSGFQTICLSYESADAARQKDSSGKVTTAELADAVEALYQAGFSSEEVTVYALMGLPGQSEAEVRDTLDTIYGLGARSYLAQFSPIPGTPEFDRWDPEHRERAVREPLLHNNTAFPYLSGDETLDPNQYRELRQLSHKLNAELDGPA